MNLLTLFLVGIALAFLVQVSIALSGVVVWALLALSAVVVLTSVAVYGLHRRVLTARDAATSHGPSFGDVLARRYASADPRL